MYKKMYDLYKEIGSGDRPTSFAMPCTWLDACTIIVTFDRSPTARQREKRSTSEAKMPWRCRRLKMYNQIRSSVTASGDHRHGWPCHARPRCQDVRHVPAMPAHCTRHVRQSAGIHAKDAKMYLRKLRSICWYWRCTSARYMQNWSFNQRVSVCTWLDQLYVHVFMYVVHAHVRLKIELSGQPSAVRPRATRSAGSSSCISSPHYRCIENIDARPCHDAMQDADVQRCRGRSGDQEQKIYQFVLRGYEGRWR